MCWIACLVAAATCLANVRSRLCQETCLWHPRPGTQRLGGNGMSLAEGVLQVRAKEVEKALRQQPKDVLSKVCEEKMDEIVDCVFDILDQDAHRTKFMDKMSSSSGGTKSTVADLFSRCDVATPCCVVFGFARNCRDVGAPKVEDWIVLQLSADRLVAHLKSADGAQLCAVTDPVWI